MHEASIALSIIEIANDHCARAGYKRVDTIEVNIGSASGVLPAALQMAFDIVKLDTPAREAELMIIEIPIGGTCNDCGDSFETDEMYLLNCPGCSGKSFVFTKGRELDVKEIEVS